MVTFSLKTKWWPITWKFCLLPMQIESLQVDFVLGNKPGANLSSHSYLDLFVPRLVWIRPTSYKTCHKVVLSGMDQLKTITVILCFCLCLSIFSCLECCCHPPAYMASQSVCGTSNKTHWNPILPPMHQSSSWSPHVLFYPPPALGSTRKKKEGFWWQLCNCHWWWGKYCCPEQRQVTPLDQQWMSHYTRLCIC